MIITIIKPFRVLSVISSHGAGGIGPVCRYAAEGLARRRDWNVTLLCLHDPASDTTDAETGLRVIGLGLDVNCARLFLQWLEDNPQDLVITSDVSRIESAFPYFPAETRHVVQIHDSGRRYQAVATRNTAWIDGVTCVGRHIEKPLRERLAAEGYRGLLRTVHNGAAFPPFEPQDSYDGPLRLLFMGRVEPLKGVFDFVPLLKRLKRMKVPVRLEIVGGENKSLRRGFDHAGVNDMVTWIGRVPHQECYSIAVRSDVFLIGSRKESFGMATIEAMSMGCVPIAYDIPSGSTEIIEDGKSGILVKLGDIGVWAKRIQELHEDRKQLKTLSEGAVRRARDQFSELVMTENLSRFLTDVATQDYSSAPFRKLDHPPEEAVAIGSTRGYQRLPAGVREVIRNWVGGQPRLCYWWLNRF